MSERGDDDEDARDVPEGAEPRDFSDLEQAFRQMLEDKFLDGLVRRFEKLFPDYSAEVEDVLFSAASFSTARAALIAALARAPPLLERLPLRRRPTVDIGGPVHDAHLAPTMRR